MLTGVLLQGEELEEGRMLTLRWLEEAPKEPGIRAFLSNNLAWADYRLRRDELRQEADAHSTAACRHFREMGFALGTRGAVLSWLGKLEEARPLLERAYTLNSLGLSRAFNACTLVVVTSALGQLEVAERWLSRARDNSSSCALLPEAEAALAPARSRLMPAA